MTDPFCLPFCNLRILMDARGLTVAQLAKAAGVGKAVIIRLRKNKFCLVDMRAATRICWALDVSFGDLFEVTLRDLWFPFRMFGDVTVHFASNFGFLRPEGPRQSAGGTPHASGVVSAWDLRAFIQLQQHWQQLEPAVRIRFREHVAGTQREGSALALVRELGGHTVLLGSPLASQYAEELLCELLNLSPNTPSEREKLPFSFLWEKSRPQTSSLGDANPEGVYGIWSREAQKVIARRTFAKPGAGGEDAALILTYRLPAPANQRKNGLDTSRLVLALLGHGGLGTLAAARIATDPEYTMALFPSEILRPKLAVVHVKYTRRPGPEDVDTRHLTAKIDLVAVTEVGTERRAGGEKPALRRSAAPRSADVSAEGDTPPPAPPRPRTSLRPSARGERPATPRRKAARR